MTGRNHAAGDRVDIGDIARIGRIALRETRGALRPVLRGQSWWNASLGPIRLPAGELLLRPPVPSDAAAWRVARLANRAELEPAFPAAGADWAAEQSALSWTDQCLRLRGQARRGVAFPYVVLLDGRLVGERLVMIDYGTSTGEDSIWLDRSVRRSDVAACSSALVSLHVLRAPRAPSRFVAPVSVTNRGPERVLQRLGYSLEGTLRAMRDTSTGRADHDIWVAHDSPEFRAGP